MRAVTCPSVCCTACSCSGRCDVPVAGVPLLFGGRSGKGRGESKASKDCRNLVLSRKLRVEVADIDLWFDHIIMLSYHYLRARLLAAIGELHQLLLLLQKSLEASQVGHGS